MCCLLQVSQASRGRALALRLDCMAALPPMDVIQCDDAAAPFMGGYAEGRVLPWARGCCGGVGVMAVKAGYGRMLTWLMTVLARVFNRRAGQDCTLACPGRGRVAAAAAATAAAAVCALCPASALSSSAIWLMVCDA